MLGLLKFSRIEQGKFQKEEVQTPLARYSHLLKK